MQDPSFPKRLSLLGIRDPLAATLASRVAQPPAGTFPVHELSNAPESRRLLLTTIVAAMEMRQFGECLPYLLAALEKETDRLSPYDMGRFWHIRGYAAWRMESCFYSATVALNNAVAILEAQSAPEARSYLARVHDTFGQLCHQQSLLDDARWELETALKIRNEFAEADGKAQTLGNLGRLCMDLGDFSGAIAYLGQDLDIVELISPEATSLRIQLLSHLGTCHFHLNNIDDARKYFDRSHSLAAENTNTAGILFAVLGHARLALRQGDCATASRRVLEAEELVTALNDVENLKLALLGLIQQATAEIHQYLDEPDAALTAFETAWHYFRQSSLASPVETAQLLFGYAQMAAIKGKPEKATDLLRQSLHFLDPTAADSLRNQIEQRLRELSRDAWLIYSSGRFLGHGQIETLFTEAGVSGFRGADKEVAILFSDLRNFTHISEQFSAEHLILILNKYLGQMTRCLEQFEGTVVQFIGDAIMALFTLPQSRVDDSEHAIRAALMMQSEIQRFNRMLPEGSPAFAMGIGIHFGPVVAGLIGSPRKRSYSVIGDPVNTASRLEGMTKILGASILVSQEIVAKLPDPDRFVFRLLGDFCPKGREKPVRVYEVMGETRDVTSAGILFEVKGAAEAWAKIADRDFKGAVETYEELAGHAHGNPRNLGYRLLAEHAREWLSLPPSEPWVASIVLTDK